MLSLLILSFLQRLYDYKKTTVFRWYAKYVSIFAEGVCVNSNYIKKNHCATPNDSCLNNNKAKGCSTKY